MTVKEKKVEIQVLLFPATTSTSVSPTTIARATPLATESIRDWKGVGSSYLGHRKKDVEAFELHKIVMTSNEGISSLS